MADNGMVERLRAQCLDAERAIVADMTAALRHCRTEAERDRCRVAYAWKLDTERDVIGQRHGLPPRRIPALSPSGSQG